MSRIAAAVVVVALVVGGAAVVDRGMRGPERIAAPPEGRTVATTLSDGAPVFVSRDADGVRVISPVTTHLLHLAYWCDHERRFVEPVGATYFDSQGRWVNGPAATGLARYEAELGADGETVLVGDLGDPLPRAERPDESQDSVGDCVGSEGRFGGTAPALPDEVGDLAALAGRVGERVVVEARVHVDEDGMRLCAYGRDRCGDEAVALSATWWPGWLDDVEGWMDGRYLVRVDGARRVSELASVRSPDDSPELVASGLHATAQAPRTARASGRLRSFDAEARSATLAELEADSGEDPESLPEPGADGTVTLPLTEDYPQLVVSEREGSAHLYPDEFESAVASRGGGVPVEVTVTEDGEIRSIWLVDAD